VGASYDVDVGVKRRPELAEWIEKDPIVALERRLEHLTDGSPGYRELPARRAEIAGEIAHALDSARCAPSPSPRRTTQHVWSEEMGIDDAVSNGISKEYICVH
jgi:TPP-dependent pyruvate/acetoin dehydrogenase alpha subunit